MLPLPTLRKLTLLSLVMLFAVWMATTPTIEREQPVRLKAPDKHHAVFTG